MTENITENDPLSVVSAFKSLLGSLGHYHIKMERRAGKSHMTATQEDMRRYNLLHITESIESDNMTGDKMTGDNMAGDGKVKGGNGI